MFSSILPYFVLVYRCMKHVGFGTVTSFDDRQLRRASIYERREAQLRRRKILTLALVIAILTTLIGLRLFSFLMKKDTADLPARDEEPAGTVMLEAAPASMADAWSVPDDTGTVPDDNPLYTPAVETPRSEDAPYFFEGYEVRMTDDTVIFESRVTDGNEVADAGSLQGAADTDDAPLTDAETFLDSEAAVLIDLDEGVIVAARNPDMLIYPASMTKILTLLVAHEQLTDRDATFTITEDITALTFGESLSSVFWQVGETVTVTDLEYGTILPSGADAAIGLARTAAGSEEALVALMNDRIAMMGLSPGAHFSTVTGMHEEDNRCTVTDMAMILKAAVEDAHVLSVLSMREYTASETPQHPDGVYMFNLFLDRTDLHTELPGMIVSAKTGYTDEALNCAASYFISDSGKHYICVTALGHGSRRVVMDHVNLYNTYTR